jgi:hypothetical protein
VSPHLSGQVSVSKPSCVRWGRVSRPSHCHPTLLSTTTPPQLPPTNPVVPDRAGRRLFASDFPGCLSSGSRSRRWLRPISLCLRATPRSKIMKDQPNNRHAQSSNPWNADHTYISDSELAMTMIRIQQSPIRLSR